MTSAMGLSRIVWTDSCDRLYSFEQAATLTETSTILLERYVALGVIEPVGAMLRPEALVRVVRIRRLRRDLGLNLVGAAMVLDMSAEIRQLKAQLKAHQSGAQSNIESKY